MDACPALLSLLIDESLRTARFAKGSGHRFIDHRAAKKTLLSAKRRAFLNK
jgi:hypothetical protein